LRLGDRLYLPTGASNKIGSTKVFDTTGLSPSELENLVRDLVDRQAGGRPVGVYDPPKVWNVKLDDGTSINLRNVSSSPVAGSANKATWTIDILNKSQYEAWGWPKGGFEIKFE